LDTKQLLTDYISQELLGGHEGLEENDNLLASGMLDSLGMLRLMGYIQEELGVQVPPEDFTIDNFRTVRAMSEYLNGRIKPTDNAA